MRNINRAINSALLATIVLSATSAHATDWSGFYLGAQAGYGVGNSDADVKLGGDWSIETASFQNAVRNGLSNDMNPKGGVLGLQAGYNWQMPNNIVFGIEAGASRLDADDSKKKRFTNPGVTYNSENEIDVKAMYSLRAKLGYAYQQTLFYTTAGWASADTDMGLEISSSANYLKAKNSSQNVNGYTVGLGVEHRFFEQLSLRIDYSYANFNKASYTTNYRPGSAFTVPPYSEKVRQDLELHQVGVGLNYYF